MNGPTYLSSGDEKAFFQWLHSLSCVKKVEGRSRELDISLRRAPNDADLKELIALMFRYDIGMSSLAQFETERNAEWFTDPNAFWYARVFATDKVGKRRKRR